MASNVFLTLGERTVMIARPSTYQDLLGEIRRHFPRVSSVYSLAVIFQPANVNGGLLTNWVEVEKSAYSAVHDGAEFSGLTVWFRGLQTGYWSTNSG
ncbi:hypothetical protein LA080_011281 [Diaporthe eres]|nr:hypothetical protein LA080_011281 [Diaporthe eres]